MRLAAHHHDVRGQDRASTSAWPRALRRYFWDPEAKKLSADESWVIYPMQKGQSTATAPTLVGDWIAVQLNGGGSETVASSVVIANQQ